MKILRRLLARLFIELGMWVVPEGDRLIFKFGNDTMTTFKPRKKSKK